MTDSDCYDPAGVDAVARGISVRHWDHVNEETREVLRGGARELLDDYFAASRPAPAVGVDIERCALVAAEAWHHGWGGKAGTEWYGRTEWRAVALAVLAEGGRAAPTTGDDTEARGLLRELVELHDGGPIVDNQPMDPDLLAARRLLAYERARALLGRAHEGGPDL